MLPTLIAERGFDLFWIDGSTTPEGQSLPGEFAATIPQLREIHREVTGGPDVAIIHSLCHMRQLGYEYCGLIENDVRLQSGWFPKLLDLFRLGQEDGLRVGVATARTYQYRVLVTRPHYAVLYNCGAGMILFRKEAVSTVLRRYRTTTAHEVRRLVLFTVGVDPARTWGGPPAFQNMCADWFFDVSLLLDGYCTLGLLPAMAEDLDQKSVEGCRGYASCPSEIPPSEELRFS